MKNLHFTLLGIMLCAAPLAAAENETETSLRNKLQSMLPEINITSIKKTPMTDIYQVTAGKEYVYISEDGQYLIKGDLIDLEQQWNLTEQERTNSRKEKFAGLNDEELIIFKSNIEKHVLYVFTDIDCGYCRKLHQEIDELNNAGITVKYLAYPATGEFTVTWNQMSEVWCANDRKTALTNAKEGKTELLASGKSTEEILACSETIKNQYQLANQFDVLGTPAIYIDNGNAIKGYMPPEKLVKKIEEIKDHATKLGMM